MESIRRWVEEAIGSGYEYEVYIERRKKTSIETSKESIENLLRAEDAGIGIRVFKGKRMGFSYTTDLRESFVKDCVKIAMQVCDITPEDEGFSLGACENLGNLQTYYDYEGLKKPIDEKIELVIGLEKYAKNLDSRVKGVRKASLKEAEVEVHCFNSCGLFYSYMGTWYTSSIAVLAEEDGDQSISYDFAGSRTLSELPLKSMVEDAVFKATATLKPSSFETRRIPIILFREASAMILEAFTPIFLGDALVKGKTFLKDMEGRKVFSEKITIVDDGRLEGGFLSLPVDSEGHPMRRNILVENGEFKGFLHSTYTAIKAGAKPTGNSIREGFKSLPTSGITNLFILPGNKSLEEMLEAEEVLLVTDLMGLHTADPVSGDFSLGASGIIYRGGKRERSARGVIIGGNIRDLLNSLVEVGSDLKFYGNVGSPSLYIKDMVVGG